MTLNPLKCQFFKKSVEFFGMTISEHGISPKKAKYQDLIDCEEPTCTKDVRSFLGFAGYFKNRSPYQSSVNKPLRDLLKTNHSFKWNDDEKNSFKEVKRIVIEEAMAFFDHTLRIELYVDAGPFGCSSFLTQIDDELRSIKLIRCDSHSYTEAEERYSHLEKEAFACVWACKTNHIYVYGRPFKLITDALSVKKIFQEDKTRKRTPIRFIRWKSDLSVYNVEFVHRAGSKNIADYLSRRFNRTPSESTNLVSTNLENHINTIVESRVPTDISLDRLIVASNTDAQIQEIKKALKLKHWGNLVDSSLIKQFKGIWNELSFSSHGILMRNDVIVIPMSLRQEVINYGHEGHIGMQLCKRLLRNICWFPTMDAMIESTIEECVPCQANTLGTTTEPIVPTIMPQEPWDTIALDHTSRSPTNDYGLGILDEGSRTTIIKIAKDLTSATAISICKNIFAKLGIPKVVKTDNGTAFTSQEWADFARKYGFHHQKITPLHPEANSGAERIMKNNNKTIRCAEVMNVPWKSITSQWLKRYNQTPHSSTGYSPNMLLLGSDNCNILPNIKPRILTPAMKAQARLNDAIAKLRMKKYADAAQHVKHREFKPEDPVMLKWTRNNKYRSLFDPYPYRVKTVKGSMIMAARENHRVTRNSKFFKIINEKCFEKAMDLVRNKLKSNIPASTTFKLNNRNIQQELYAYINTQTNTPPETPMQQITVTHDQGQQATTNTTPLIASTSTLSPELEQRKSRERRVSFSETATTICEPPARSTRSSSRQTQPFSYKNAYRIYPKDNS